MRKVWQGLDKLALLSACIVGLAVPAHAAPLSVVGHFDGNANAARDFDARGDLGCLVTEHGQGPEFYLLSLQDPNRPTRLGSMDVPGRLNRVVLGENLAYLATSLNDQELLIADTAAPTSPIIIGSYDIPSIRDAISLAARGTLLFLGTKRSHSTAQHELYAFDVSDPTAPRLLDSIDLGAHVNDLVMDGDILYAATSDNAREVVALDVSDPTAMAVLASVDLPGAADAQGIDVHGGLIYVVRRAHRDNFDVLSASTYEQISVARLEGRGQKVRVYRDRAYVATDRGRAGLQIIDIGDPSQPVVLNSVEDTSGASVRIAAPRAYLTSNTGSDGLLVLDTSAMMRPNVVVIYTDDQHPASVGFMPELQDLANRGLTFEQSFVTTPVCGPSRSSLLTGLYTHNHGTLVNVDYIGKGPGAIGSDQSTLATWLQGAGYRTGFFGKYVNGYKHNCATGVCSVPPGWDEWHAAAGSGPGHIYYNYSISNNGILESFGSAPEDYSNDVLAQKALAFIEEQDNRPFFAILAVNAPHLDNFVSVYPAPRHVGAFAGVAPWRPPSYDEEDVSDKPSPFADLPRAWTPHPLFPTYGAYLDHHRQQQLEALLSVDEAIGEILQSLERSGEEQDTVVIFTSDNGYLWGEHRRWSGKIDPYEESIRVPLTVVYPRLVEAGQVDSTHMVLNIDLAPTIAELAGTVPGGPVDGRSFVALLEGADVPEWRTDFLIEQYGAFFPTETNIYQGIRHASGTYAYYLNLGEEELYDLIDDVDQMENQASNPLYDSVRLQFRDRMNQLMTNDALRVDF